MIDKNLSPLTMHEPIIECLQEHSESDSIDSMDELINQTMNETANVSINICNFIND